MKEPNPPQERRRSRVRPSPADIIKSESGMERPKNSPSRAKKQAPESTEDLATALSRTVVGQPAATRLIVPYIQMFQAGLAPEGRPVGVFLLLGPTGTGKTKTVEALAEILHGSEKNVLKVDCGEFQMEHEVAKLIGRPAVRRYTSWITAPNSSIATTLVDTDPMSRPRYAAIGSPFDRWAAGGTYTPTRSLSCTTFSEESGFVSWMLSSTSCCRRRCTSRMERLRCSSASRMAVPMAPHQAYSAGTKSCSAVSEKASRSALTTPAFCDTAPISATGASTGRPFTTELLKLRATASHSPRRISAGEYPFCCAWIMSLLANTLQRPAIRAAHPAPHTSSPTSSTEYCMRSACWSRNDPVPAAHSPERS